MAPEIVHVHHGIERVDHSHPPGPTIGIGHCVPRIQPRLITENAVDARATHYFDATKQTVQSSYNDLYIALLAAYPFKDLVG
ncbi:hypothetical protein ACIRRA_08790 [Nocardia sp. NPDC101769]|uniref:hypothetical protein n=1 Tax=Nocardia sp. NPDC101769 TaxID=3364333 RepID=UPI003814A3DA